MSRFVWMYYRPGWSPVEVELYDSVETFKRTNLGAELIRIPEAVGKVFEVSGSMFGILEEVEVTV